MNLTCKYCLCEVTRENMANRCDVLCCLKCDVEVDKSLIEEVATDEIYQLQVNFFKEWGHLC